MIIFFKEKRIIYFILGIILLTHTFILTKLIYFPYPEFFIYPYLTNHNLKPYSQIIDQHFPGLMFFSINLNNLGMNTPIAARVWSIAIVLIIHIMIFLIGRWLFKNDKKALLANILFLIWNPFFEGWVFWIDSFLPLILLPSFYAFYKRKFFITGLLLGLGIVFKQTIIPLSFFILLYLFLSTKNFKFCLKFLIGLLIPISLMLIYIINLGVLSDFWYWTVTFNLTTYAKFGTKLPPSSGYILRILLVYGFAFLGFLNKKKGITIPLFIYIIGSMIGAFERADFVHLQPSLPFIVLATVYSFEYSSRFKTLGKWSTRIVYLVISIWWLNIFYKGHLGDRIISFDSDTKNLSTKIKEYTNPGEKIFILGSEPHLYQMTNTLPAGNIFVLQFPWFFKIAENRILQGIIMDKPNIIVSDKTVTIEGSKITEFANNISQYIDKNYKIIDKVGTADILRKI